MKRNNIEKCRNLRKNQTDAEKKLWAVLRNRQMAGTKFRRQFSIGRYILDFYSPKYRVGIEADGGGHYEDRENQRDKLRTKELSILGIEILRFSNLEILNNIEGVCEVLNQPESELQFHMFEGLIQNLASHWLPLYPFPCPETHKL